MKFMKSKAEQYRAEGVAIVGMAGRFPGAETVEAFWENLAAGVESIRFSTEEELLAAGVDALMIANRNYVRASSTVHEPDHFDAAFFGFSNREAEIIDPQQRVFLECAWEAIEDAGCDPDRFAGAIGVFAGAGMNTYAMTNIMSRPDVIASAGEYQVMVGNDKDFLSTRVAYKLNLTGPAIGVQTACSTSLVAVQMAYESLLRGECDAALAGGVSIPTPQFPGYMYVPGMIRSRDGHCRAFDAEASGTVPGAGAGVLVLKRLADALTEGDHIYAVIKGAAINNDGSSKVGYSAPSVEGQAAVIRRSMEMAGFAPESIGYVEAHGTGTEVGDPIEFSALARVFEGAAQQKGSCALGALKTNIGHLDAASGVAGLMKAALAIQHRAVPPTLHFKQSNPLLDLKATAFHVNTSLLPYESEGPFRAGVSSFGIGGTNAHVSLEEAPELRSDASEGAHLIVLSAKSAAALRERVMQLALFVERNPSANLADIAFTLQTGRKPFQHRYAMVSSSASQLTVELQRPRTVRMEGASDAGASGVGATVAFLFPGQGSQYVNMGRGLYASQPVFREVVDQCSERLKPHLQLDLRTILFPDAGDEEEATKSLGETAMTQPALFVIEYAMAKLWMSCGVVPAAMLGHSVGEYVAACLAGVFSLDDALALVAERGRLIQSMPGGAMLAVSLPEQDLEPMLSVTVSIAAVNSPGQTVASGDAASIAALEAALQKRNVPCRRLRTSHAFHSPMLEPIVDEFVKRVAKIELKAPTMRYLSNVTGTWITEADATDAGYWGAHLRNTVRFAECLRLLMDDAETVLLEAGPGDTLLSLVKRKGAGPEGAMIASMRHALAAADDSEFWLSSAGRLWLLQTPLDWNGFHAGRRRRKVSLPTYPFQRQRHYIEPGQVGTSPKPVVKDSGLERLPDIGDWFYAPSWRRSVADARKSISISQTWLVLAEDGALVNALAAGLADEGKVIQVKTGAGFRRVSEACYTIDPARREDYDDLFQELRVAGMLPSHIVHSFTVGLNAESSIERAVDLSVLSAMALMQAMAEKATGAAVQFNLLSDRAYSLLGEAISNPAAAALHAFCKVVPVEFPNVTTRTIDVDMRTGFARTARQLVEELKCEAGDETVAYRGTARWLEEWEPVHLNVAGRDRHTGPDLSLRQGGTYLITGGTGGIGLVLGRHIAQRANAKLILTSRKPLPPISDWDALLEDQATPSEVRRQIEGVRTIERCGGEVVLFEADASDAMAMMAAVAAMQKEHGPIRGIVHAAGVAGAGMVATKSREQMQATLSAKVQGSEWIRELIDAQELDFVMLCSSISAVVPGFGLSDYAAANAYMDGFAMAYDDPEGTRVLSVGWDTWREVGMAANAPVPEGLVQLRDESIRHGLLSHEAAEVFDRILQSPMPHVVVSTRPLASLLELVGAGIGSARRSMGEVLPRGAAPRVDIALDPAGTENEVEGFILEVWRELLGSDEIAVDDNFFQLGGHSLLGTQVLARLQDRYGVNLPMRAIFESATPALLAQSVRLASWASSVESMTPNLEREEIEF